MESNFFLFFFLFLLFFLCRLLNVQGRNETEWGVLGYLGVLHGGLALWRGQGLRGEAVREDHGGEGLGRDLVLHGDLSATKQDALLVTSSTLLRSKWQWLF